MSVFGSPLKVTALERVINRMKSPNDFLQRFLFPVHDSIVTEDIEMSSISKGREMAPFVHSGAEAVMVGGRTETFQTVSGPNIRIKRPLNPADVYKVIPGGHKYDPRTVLQAVARYRQENLQLMNNYVTNSIEWLVSQALQGTITYAVEGQDSFLITYPRPSSTNITLSVFWDDATPANVKILKDLHAVKKVFSDETGLTPTDCILGSAASAAFRALIEGGHIKTLVSNYGQVDAGTATFTSQYSEAGVIYLGNIGGIRFWEYSRTQLMNGASVDLIRSKYAEFVSTSSASERVLKFASVPDLDAPNGVYVGERFAKEFKKDDPSSLFQLMHSRPLPIPRKPEATVSVKVCT